MIWVAAAVGAFYALFKNTVPTLAEAREKGISMSNYERRGDLPESASPEMSGDEPSDDGSSPSEEEEPREDLSGAPREGVRPIRNPFKADREEDPSYRGSFDDLVRNENDLEALAPSEDGEDEGDDDDDASDDE